MGHEAAVVVSVPSSLGRAAAIGDGLKGLQELGADGP